MLRPMVLTLAAACALLGCESSDVTGPGARGALGYQLNGQSFAINGSPASDPDRVLAASFAVARADSVGGFVLVGYQRTGTESGHLFILQAPREVKSFACGGVFDGQSPCHGRYLTGVSNLNTTTAARYYHVTSGNLTVTQVGPARLRGTFRLTLKANDNQPGDTLVVENGTIDVPYVADQVTDGTLQCLLSLVGIGNGTCRS